ncbi:hypothetical protein [Paludisphaera sp.]|uniref:hypothetical protein n=1 Tax=Paludisphaera sp. TaxID=2017432 RepID=UPI00301C9FF6
MRRFPFLALGLASMILASSAAVAGDDAKAREIAEKVTTEGAAIFDTLDARAMAATYDEKGVIVAYQKENGAIVRETHEGREKVEAAYAKIFENPETIKSRNTVDHARLLAPDLLSIDGTFEMNTLKPGSPRIAFHQVRLNKGGKWLVLTMEISLVKLD